MSISKTPAQFRAAKLVKRGLNGAIAGIQHCNWNGGARRDRTDDLKLAKLPLSQLSYGPLCQDADRLPDWLSLANETEGLASATARRG